MDFASTIRALEAAGCVAAREEAEELITTAQDDEELQQMLSRRLKGEPLAWIIGRVRFCGLDVEIDVGVYVPRWQSQPLAIAAAELLPRFGRAVDLCTGSGAVAMAMQSHCPDARVVATEIDPVAVNCARRNGVTVYEGSLDEPLPGELTSQVDVMTGVLPYVPNDAFRLLPRDVQHFEPRRALLGGEDGLALISRAIRSSSRWVKRGGWLLLEIGSNQADGVSAMLVAMGYSHIDVLDDDEGDARAIIGQLDASRTDAFGLVH